MFVTQLPLEKSKIYLIVYLKKFFLMIFWSMWPRYPWWLKNFFSKVILSLKPIKTKLNKKKKFNFSKNFELFTQLTLEKILKIKKFSLFFTLKSIKTKITQKLHFSSNHITLRFQKWKIFQLRGYPNILKVFTEFLFQLTEDFEKYFINFVALVLVS